MVRKPQDVTDAELAILRQLWEASPATIRQITDALYDGTAQDDDVPADGRRLEIRMRY